MTSTTTTKTVKTSAKAKAGNKKFGGQRNNKRMQVVRMRNKDSMSWREISVALEIAPRTVRRLYDEKAGTDAHFASRIPGKGGRVRAAVATCIMVERDANGYVITE